MTFTEFATYLHKLEAESSRLEMTYLLAELFAKLKGDEIKVAVYLMQGSLVPEYQSLEFNLSTKMVQKVLARILNSQSNKTQNSDLFGEVADDDSALQNVTALYQQMGDLGATAEKIIEQNVQNSKDQNLSITQVHQDLVKIAQEEGAGSQERKIVGLKELLLEVDALSARYIVRMVIGKVRLGFSAKTIMDALSWATTQTKDESSRIEEAYQKKADLGELAVGYLQQENPQKREQFLESYAVQVGVPVVPALCQRLNSAQEIIDKLGEVYAEPKYDGLRVQIHFKKLGGSKAQVKAFTRNLEDVSYMFPELDLLAGILKCEACILDAEAIGYDPQTKQLVEFQQTITRRRKHQVGDKAKELPMRFYVFDVLAKDGRDLLTQTLVERKKILANLFESNQILFETEYLITQDQVELHQFHEQQLDAGLEGAVIKRADGQYTSGRKGWNWVKIKEAEGTHGKLSDTLDVVVMGYYLGRGKRAEFGMGAILVGVWDETDQQIKTVSKIGTGLSDQKIKDLKKIFDQHQLEQQPKNYQVDKNLYPEVWIEPTIVVEVAADEITNSPIHTSGKALRFPRFVKIREDKDYQQSTTLKELSEISHLR